jgi:cyanophycinase
MSIHLVGGGWHPDYFGALYRTFVAEAEARAAGAGRVVPRIGVLLVLSEEDSADEVRGRYSGALKSVASCETVVHTVAEGETFGSAVLNGIDALLVGGGLTPAYLQAVAGLIDEIRLLVADGLPYLGFSAGAAIAADSAILGGWRIGEVPVCPEEAGEDLDEVTLAEGLALVDLAVDAHAVQWGTLARVIAATEAGLLDGGVAIDESTVLIVGDGALRVEGRGNVWQVSEDSAGVLVRTVGS